MNFGSLLRSLSTSPKIEFLPARRDQGVGNETIAQRFMLTKRMAQNILSVA
jgi:hypothetical protein